MLEISNLSHHFDGVTTLDDITLRLDKGRIGCILGPSGSGKTTLLRCIAGFERTDRGEIFAAGQLLNQDSFHVPPEKRCIGMVFQDYALLPHLTVLDNVIFGLRDQSRDESRRRGMEMLQRVELGGLADRFPHQLSGGQQQRVAIARALAPRPHLLLMDEPFSNLDASMRNSLGREIRELLRELEATTLIVTHDHHEAFAMADDAGVLEGGRLLQWDTVYQLYHRPVNRYVAEFIGQGAWLPGLVTKHNVVEIELGLVTGSMKESLPVGTRVDLLLRPDDVVHDDASSLLAKVVEKSFRGSEFLYTLELPSGARLISSVPSHHDHHIGEMIGIQLETDHMVVFEKPVTD